MIFQEIFQLGAQTIDIHLIIIILLQLKSTHFITLDNVTYKSQIFIIFNFYCTACIFKLNYVNFIIPK